MNKNQKNLIAYITEKFNRLEDWREILVPASFILDAFESTQNAKQYFADINGLLTEGGFDFYVLAKNRFSYIVTRNNPYYPAVYYAKSLEDAKEKKQKWAEELSSENGEKFCKISIAQVLETNIINCDY